MLDAEWLKITRIRLGLTQEQVATEMHMTKQALSLLERGKTNSESTMAWYEHILNHHIEERGGLRDIF